MLRLIMVARPAVASMCNDAAQNSIADGNRPFDVPLRLADDATNNVVAYWCDWTMTADQKTALDSALASSSVVPAATAAEKHIYAVTETLPALSSTQRIVICDSSAGQWVPDQALATMGLDRLAVTL